MQVTTLIIGFIAHVPLIVASALLLELKERLSIGYLEATDDFAAALPVSTFPVSLPAFCTVL